MVAFTCNLSAHRLDLFDSFHDLWSNTSTVSISGFGHAATAAEASETATASSDLSTFEPWETHIILSIHGATEIRSSLLPWLLYFLLNILNLLGNLS